jgi:probable rRNA maturation factor
MKSRNSESGLRDRTARKKERLKLTTQYATIANRVPTRAQFRKWVIAALNQDAEITLRIVDEAEGLGLNSAYRGKDYPTNVLTFAYSQDRLLSGDIALCAPVVENEARQQNVSIDAHYAHLTVHGLLHLQGYGHDDAAAAAIMEQLETRIMNDLGYDDPYKEHQPDTADRLDR